MTFEPPKSAPRIAVILAGGGGTRLWPASRRRLPKQLLKLGGDESLLAAAARRARALFGPGHTLVVTAADQEQQIRSELPDLPRDALIVEPAPRNTAAAVGLGAAAVVRRFGPDARMAVFPADPHIALFFNKHEVKYLVKPFSISVLIDCVKQLLC